MTMYSLGKVQLLRRPRVDRIPHSDSLRILLRFREKIPRTLISRHV